MRLIESWLLALIQSTSKRRHRGLVQKQLSNKTKVFEAKILRH